MENYLTEITSYLLTQSWQIAVLVGVIAAVSLALKNRSAHIRYLLWLIVLAKCLVPPLLTVPVAILINGFRVFLTGFLVFHVSPELGEGFMHMSEGWAMFVIAFLILGGMAWVLVRLEHGIRRRFA